ncbi:hypothetical protein D3C71_234710 [compost metagenome]
MLTAKLLNKMQELMTVSYPDCAAPNMVAEIAGGLCDDCGITDQKKIDRICDAVQELAEELVTIKNDNPCYL